MKRRIPIVALVISVALTMLAFATRGAAQAPGGPPVIVHEWGTFTSIAGADGTAAQWQPLGGRQDLPCFVEQTFVNSKGVMGTVRMETPVLYFYAPGATTVRVGVQFRQGIISEWYPHATVTSSPAVDWRASGARGTITWSNVRVSPGAVERFPAESETSHYYAARATDAAPVEVDGKLEKFLFYRGVGAFQPPLSAMVAAGGGVTMSSNADRLGDLILFENRDGSMAYKVREFSGRQGAFEPLSHDGESVAPVAELERLLISHGLYPKEAAAMVATWRDSWFEEGTRLFYVAPRRFVDDTLPLTINPAPSAVSRVFVGRLELITPDRLAAMKSALARGDTAALLRSGRFLQPIVDRILASTPQAGKRRILDAVAPAYGAALPVAPVCH